MCAEEFIFHLFFHGKIIYNSSREGGLDSLKGNFWGYRKGMCSLTFGQDIPSYILAKQNPETFISTSPSIFSQVSKRHFQNSRQGHHLRQKHLRTRNRAGWGYGLRGEVSGYRRAYDWAEENPKAWRGTYGP